MKGLALKDLRVILQIKEMIGQKGQRDPQDLVGSLQRGQEHPDKGHQHQKGPEHDQSGQGPGDELLLYPRITVLMLVHETLLPYRCLKSVYKVS